MTAAGGPAAEPVAAPGPVALRVTAFDDPVARTLVAAVQQEYVRRYGGPDETQVQPGEFAPPAGLFVVAWQDAEPVGCGGWRRHGRDTAEIKRMYVVPAARGRGLARALLAELERAAAAAGCRRIVLETGEQQPEAVSLYASSGYAPVPPFGRYADADGARHLGKVLAG